MTSPRVAHNGHGNKGTYSRFIPATPKAKSGADLFNEGAPLSACENRNQVNEWLAAEAAGIESYLAEEAERINLRRSLAYLDCCRLEGVPAAKACAVLC